MHILKKREKALEELEEKKRRVEGDVKLSTIDNKFSTHNNSIEAQLRSSTVGLVTLDQMRQKQEYALREREKQLAQKVEDDSKLAFKPDAGETSAATSAASKKTKSLSFYDEDDDDDDEEDKEKLAVGDSPCKDGNGKNSTADKEPEEQDLGRAATEHEGESPQVKKPKLEISTLDVDTTFLPDRDREEEERRLRETLASEWRERQQRLKEEEIEITFSYWDGSGHRRMVKMKKGNSIYQFLQACSDVLRKDFNELRAISADQLMYVKEDLIIPHHYTFYDFIVTKARGKSGPLFSFDVHEDVRLSADASVEKDESHAGKVLLRGWYERNKHIFPASRWEPYDPTKTYDKYTISDKRIK